ncbi:hypothetical protein N7499_009766 [Penicillium canescens]|nr:hypothetical protein N7499_009766 [Penicillium canescens]
MPMCWGRVRADIGAQIPHAGEYSLPQWVRPEESSVSTDIPYSDPGTSRVLKEAKTPWLAMGLLTPGEVIL